jgi:uncharacterized membrane protein YedE/YeeE
MLLETYEFGVEARTLQLLFGLGLGLVFGVAAQISRFCLRRAVAGEEGADGSAAAVWLAALATAVAGVFLASSYGLVDVSEHRLMSSSLPIVGVLVGGLLFGAGMVLTRGCVSRLTVLSAGGNLRAFAVLAVFAIVAHAAMKGVLAPLRVALSSVQVELPFASLAELPGAAPLAIALLAVLALFLGRRFGARARDMALGAVIGLVVVGGWATTSVLLYDEFDPLAVQPVAFTLPWSDTLFWVIASSAIPAGFGTGLIAGVLLGAGASALLRGEFAWQSFETPAQTGRYLLGGSFMGLGGVLAGGCTVGAGLSGGAALSVAALLALGTIILGGVATRFALSQGGATRAA